MGVVSITVMIVGGRMILAGKMTIGDFFAFTLYLGFMVAPVFMMVSIGTQITEAFAGLDRMHEVFEEQPEDIDPKRSEEHTSELQSQSNLVCRLLLEKKKIIKDQNE